MEFPYTPESERQKRAAEISANLKHIHDTQTAYCQACYMELSECPGHEGNLPREHGTFYMQLLKERTLLREVVEEGDWEYVDALYALEEVFDNYHERMEEEAGSGEPTGGIIKDFGASQELWGFDIPLQLGDPPRKGPAPAQGYTSTQVVDDRTVDLKPGQMCNTPEVEFSEIANHYLTDSQLWYVNEEVKQRSEVRMEDGYFDVAEKPVEAGPVGLGTAPLREEGQAIHPDDPWAWYEPDDEGVKHDEGKDRWDLLPPSISKVVDVYTIGAAKYSDDNWAKGMGYRRIFGAMMRHAWKWFWGESYDQDDGQHHLASVAWACLTLMHYEDEGVGTDDRAFKPMDRPVPPQPTMGNPPPEWAREWARAWDLAHSPNDEPVYGPVVWGYKVTQNPNGQTTIEPLGH